MQKFKKNEVRLDIQFDSITLFTPAGKYRHGRNGITGQGMNHAAFNKMTTFVNNHINTGGTLGTAMDALCVPETLSKLWPNYDIKAPSKDDFKIGDTVRFKDILLIAKYGDCIVVEKKVKNLLLSSSRGKVRCAPSLVEVIK
jgi:hypothetical protein